MKKKTRIRVKGLEMVSADRLVPNAKNFRRHSESQRAVLDGILDEVGFAGAIVARELEDGRYEIIDGHLRADASAGEKLPVLVTDLDDQEADKVLATYDAIGGMATIDEFALDNLLELTAFEDENLEKLLKDILPYSLSDIEPIDPPELSSGDKSPFQQMTFILHDSQVEKIVAALKKAKKESDGFGDLNENSNGNALAYIAESYLGKS